MPTTDKSKEKLSTGDLIASALGQKSKSDYFSLICKNILIRALRDLSCRDQKIVQEVSSYVESDLFDEHIEQAGMPSGLKDAMREIIELNPIQRRVTVRVILMELKKKPRSYRGN